MPLLHAVKALLYSEPAAWKRFMTKLITVLADFLVKHAQAGTSALLVSDPWAGLALGRDDYLRFVQPYNRTLFTAIRRSGVPAIHFSAGTSGYLADVAEAGADVLGVDWRMPLDWCWGQMDRHDPYTAIWTRSRWRRHGANSRCRRTACWRRRKDVLGTSSVLAANSCRRRRMTLFAGLTEMYTTPNQTETGQEHDPAALSRSAC